jgi:hypothetical protein
MWNPRLRRADKISPIIDGYAAKRSHQIVLGLGRCRNIFAGERTELEAAVPTPPAAPWLHALAPAQLRDTMDQLIRRGVVQN